MPDKLCRTCGGDLIKWSTCTECRKVTQRICRMCNLKTLEDFHFHNVSIVQYSMLGRNTHATVQSYYDVSDVQKPRKSRRDTRYLSSMLVIFGVVVGMIVLGMSGVTYLQSSYNHKSTDPLVMVSSEMPHVSQTVPETNTVVIPHSDNDVKPTYNNCLGIANGVDLTVTCPTGYGYIYKAVVEIPSDLISQFENKVFSLRGISVTEHVDSISIEYGTIMYESKFMNS